MARKDCGPIERIVNAIRYSLKGLREGRRTQQALRYEFTFLLAAVPFGWSIGKTALSGRC